MIMRILYIALCATIFGAFCAWAGYIAGQEDVAVDRDMLSDAIRCHKDGGCSKIYDDVQAFGVDTLDLDWWVYSY